MTASDPCSSAQRPASWWDSTGKERDAETGLDYFGARYYSGAQGRFTAPDPLFIELRRLADPQQLNLYSYARNNPLRFIDPNGLDIQLNCSTRDECVEAVRMLNGRGNAQFKVMLGLDKKLQVVSGSAAKNLSKAEQALFNAIDDDSKHATLNVYADTGKTEFGVRDSNGVNSIDLGNLSKLDAPSNTGGLNSGDVIAHEGLESYFGLSNNTPHNQTVGLFPGLGPHINDQFGTDSTGNFLTAGRWQQEISDGRGTMQITTAITPIPKQSLIGKTPAQKLAIIDAAPKRVKEVSFAPNP
jgi:RHS repeat-associated protein